MDKKIAKRIAGWSCRDSEDFDEYLVVLYGIEIIIENLVKFIILILIGVLTRHVQEILIILLSFCLVRCYAGGIHLKTNLGCTALMVAIVVGSLLMNQFARIFGIGYWIIGNISNILIIMYAPNGSTSCEGLDGIERKRKKGQALCVANVLFIIAFYMGMEKLIFIPIFMETLTLLLFEKLKGG